ncbi:hypothetical protein FB462_0470 [Curtobacterium citreum]|nr:hypothetical protein FB462_0470 [Curtobacterium citreum]
MPVAAKFSCFSGSAHALVPHGAPRRSTDSSAPVAGVYEHIHGLTGVPVPESRRSAVDSAPTGQSRTQYAYGAPVGGVVGLRALALQVGADEHFGRREKIRFGGIDHWWHELAFAPTGNAFSALTASIETQVTKHRAYYVEGLAKYNAYPVAEGKRLELTLLDASGRSDDAISVFMPNSHHLGALTSAVAAGTPFALFSSEAFVKNTGRAALSLADDSQLLPLSG